MSLRPRTLSGESLLQQGLLEDPTREILDRICDAPSSDAASVSLSEPDPYKCQIPLARNAPRCREYCQRAMSQRAIECEDNCRKYLLMIDMVTGETYRGFVTLSRYLLAPAGGMLRVTLLAPLVVRMSEQMAA